MSAGTTFPEVIANASGEQKHKPVKTPYVSRRLNLGAGECRIEGYINVDRSNVVAPWEVYPLDFDDESVDEVRASHILEHFSHRESQDVLREWVRVLKPGGILKIAVPDFKWIAEKYLAGEDIPVQGYVMGGHVDENDHHGTIYDEDCLREQMIGAGLVDIKPWESEIMDCASLPVSLNLMGRKPAKTPYDEMIKDSSVRCRYCSDCEGCNGDTVADEVADLRDQDAINKATWERDVREDSEYVGHAAAKQLTGVSVETLKKEVRAVLSSNRLMFADTVVCAFSALVPLNIPLAINTGVFWGQALTAMMEKHVDDGSKYILTLDFDTLFSQQDVLDLYWLMETHPEIDALCSLQMRREGNTPLMTIASRSGDNIQTIHADQMNAEVMQINSAHFGLTMIRVEALNKAKKPWFHHIPDAKGEWGPEHMDEDVYFWHNWKHSGLTLFQANRVAIGHLQLVGTWPTRHLTPHFQYLKDWYTDGKPKEATV